MRSQGRKEEGAANPNSGERVHCHVSASDRIVKLVNSGQLVNSSQLVKVSSQLWSKLQIWLNERGRIGNWTGIKGAEAEITKNLQLTA